VIRTTPLPGVGLTKDEVTAPVQTATGFTDAGNFIARPFNSPVIDGS
jgi:hypothetical protein